MTDREKAIVMAHTGICMLTGDKFQIFHKYVEDILGRPVWTHDIGFFENEIKEIKAAVGDRTLKVIIETKALEDYEKANAAKVAENSGADFVKTSTGFMTPNHIYENVNDINIIQKYAPKIKIEIFGGVDSYKLANQVLTAGADQISSNYGYEIVKQYKELRENTQVKPKPITLNK